jgi:co-chaperonin GroES (HSP10)
MEFQPIGNLVLVEIIEEKMREGIYIASDYTDPRIGIVRGIGKGRKTKKGIVPITNLSIGNRVLMPQSGKKYVTLDGVRYWIISADEILGVLDAA